MAAENRSLTRLRDTVLRGWNGEYDLDAIFNRELYPAIKALFGEIAATDRFVPRFVTGASNPVLVSDECALIVVDHSSAAELTFSVADAATFEVGAWFAWMQYGAGEVTLNKAGMAPLTAETLTTRKQYSGLFVAKLRDDEWWVCGDFELF